MDRFEKKPQSALGRRPSRDRDLNAAEAICRRVVVPYPGDAEALSNRLFALNHDDGLDPRAVFEAHLRFGRLCGRLAAATPGNEPRHRSSSRLRLGYVLSDVHAHSAWFFLEPVLHAHDREAFEICGYAEVASGDPATARFASLCDRFLVTSGMSDRELAERIRADGIDILVDLAGHTAHNRLVTFAYKPAPVQIAYLGYPNTTGLAAMDYRLTDACADPAGMTDPYYTERLIRMPQGFLCYRPPEDAPEVSPPPALAKGYVTFGGSGDPAGVTGRTIALWASILKAMPRSRLRLTGTSAVDAAVRRGIEAAFAEEGIASSRLELTGGCIETADRLSVYREVDIALDTFPWHGTATTCEALWMGVPVIAREGVVPAARAGVSILTRAGLPELIAKDDEEYMLLALRLARNPELLWELRRGLRAHLRASPLCDVDTFTWDLEEIYREVLALWQSTRMGPPDGSAHIAIPESSGAAGGVERRNV